LRIRCNNLGLIVQSRDAATFGSSECIAYGHPSTLKLQATFKINPPQNPAPQSQTIIVSVIGHFSLFREKTNRPANPFPVELRFDGKG
jgi:hypothetical protein